MSEEQIERSAEEQAFIERVSETWAPPEPTSAQRAAFRARLEERLGRPRRATRLLLASASVAAATAAIWLGAALLAGPDAVQTGLPLAEDDLAVLGTEALGDPDEALPDDYLAIESIFLGS